MSLTLFIGNKAYSSWSLRPWLLMRALDIPFTEVVTPLYVDGSRERMLREAPTGKVPVLRAGDFAVWDSLAIVEYLAEAFPDKNIWPRGKENRARARSLCAEMHSGFQALRQACPTNFRRARRAAPLGLEEAARADLARVQAIFAQAGKSFLFGDFCAADAFFAPVVSRLDTYALELEPAARAYCDRILALPAFRQWREDAKAESWVIDRWEDL
ncbi:glutathione S-transferase family protein [Rhodoblastus acidophilus]|uniref:Glutathione S-transferase family protein n=1 Tax=Candidatus Rhodoblastus alkanivorans TaxID=2954117 RepID=A0ABS9Z5Z7_9HYPH|nr:glutathione S-transferase family protein [Candidatus Rhodoblastus alkanivorans]MCI4680280.1 glutathione S-transferase family protein [Candidatus Rhodoblastus alkanivorans]MCI4683099.1 glutathione S-transferase family protein [Candidatus Rhodoblastus alkanivorans]MDI4640410.1 glutathione S-transferase family protein [Rhodoblastus acidophilus]